MQNDLDWLKRKSSLILKYFYVKNYKNTEHC